MLLVFLPKGSCGAGCGGLDKMMIPIANLLGDGKSVGSICDFGQLVAFCYPGEKWFDYLVIYKKASREDVYDEYVYDPATVTPEEVRTFEDVACRILSEVKKLVGLHGAVLTRNPFPRLLAIGRVMTKEDVVAYCADRSPKGKWIEGMLLSDVYTAEAPVYLPGGGIRRLKCADICG